jgi:hypothetical protein
VKRFTYLFVNTHPKSAAPTTTFVINAESRDVADDCIRTNGTEYVHLLKVTEEDIGEAPGATRESRGMV